MKRAPATEGNRKARRANVSVRRDGDPISANTGAQTDESPAAPTVELMRPIPPVQEAPALEVLPSNDMDAATVAQLAVWLSEPWTFVRDTFDVTPDFWQDELLHAIVDAKTPQGMAYVMFCLKACKGPGKTAVLAWIIWWFMLTHDQAKGFATSITGDNLSDNLWAELARWRLKSPMLTNLFGYQSDSIFSYAYPDTWFFSARTWPKDAAANTQAATLAGLHGPNTILVLDEAGGIPVGVLVAGLAHHSTNDTNAEIPECHLTFLAGNPDTIDGALGWACTEDAAHWWVKEITGDPDDPHRAPRIDVHWAREMIRIFGANNPWVLVNVFGKFPPVGANKLVGPDQVRTAMHVRHFPEVWKDKARVMALDVARSTGRDRSVLTRRQGVIVFPQIVYRIDDATELAGQVIFEFGRWPAQAIFVDIVGVGGPVYDHLKSLGLPVIAFNGGLPARDGQRFVDRRTEVAWQCAQAIKGQGEDPAILSLPNSPELVAEATAPTIKYMPNGKMRLESKEDMLKRGVPSPDLWDSLCMTFAEPVLSLPSVVSSSPAARPGQLITRYDPFEDRGSSRREEDF